MLHYYYQVGIIVILAIFVIITICCNDKFAGDECSRSKEHLPVLQLGQHTGGAA